jgi:hypothetical protein
MRPADLALCLIIAAALAGCDDDPPATPADTGVIADGGGINDNGTVPDLGGKQDSPGLVDFLGPPPDNFIPDANPACPPAKPTGFCDAATAPICSYGNDTCKCDAVCSGVQPPPGQTHHWVCAPPPPAACPKSAPKDGAGCSPNGLKCSYGSCAVTTAECVNGKWNVTFMPPPP